MNTFDMRDCCRLAAPAHATHHPFECAPVRAGGQWMRPIAGTVDERVRMVNDFTYGQCGAALRHGNLQKGVLAAIDRRLRELERTS